MTVQALCLPTTFERHLRSRDIPARTAHKLGRQWSCDYFQRRCFVSSPLSINRAYVRFLRWSIFSSDIYPAKPAPSEPCLKIVRNKEPTAKVYGCTGPINGRILRSIQGEIRRTAGGVSPSSQRGACVARKAGSSTRPTCRAISSWPACDK